MGSREREHQGGCEPAVGVEQGQVLERLQLKAKKENAKEITKATIIDPRHAFQ